MTWSLQRSSCFSFHAADVAFCESSVRASCRLVRLQSSYLHQETEKTVNSSSDTLFNDESVNLKRLTSVKRMNSQNKPTTPIVTVSPSSLHHFLLFCSPFKNRRIPSVSVFLEDGCSSSSSLGRRSEVSSRGIYCWTAETPLTELWGILVFFVFFVDMQAELISASLSCCQQSSGFCRRGQEQEAPLPPCTRSSGR